MIYNSLSGKRETKILKTAKELLIASPGSLDEALIDCQFLFRFEQVWCSWVLQIRQLIWGLLGEINNASFSMNNSEHIGLAIHLERNKGIGVGVGPDGLFIENNNRGYRPFNNHLREWTDNSWKRLKDRAKVEQVWSEIWQEANQVSKMHSETRRLGLAYGLIPHQHEFVDYSPNQISEFYKNVFNWIMWARIVPIFRWTMSRLIESKVEDSLQRTVRPHKWPTGHWQDKETQ